MHPSGRTNQEEVEEAHTRAGAARQALVLRTQPRGAPRVEHKRVEDCEGRVGRHNLRVVGVDRMVEEGQDSHMELVVPEGERTRTAELVVAQVDSPLDHMGLEVGGHRDEQLDPGSRSWLITEGKYSTLT